MSYGTSTLLIVDDEAVVCRSLRRGLRKWFDNVHVASHPDDAERILAQTEVTNLICDYHLGESLPRGTELLVKWRQAYPRIRRAVIYSGADLSAVIMPQWVDELVSKAAPTERLYTAIVEQPIAREISV